MVITCKKDAPQEELNKIITKFENYGMQIKQIEGEDYTLIVVVGDTAIIDEKRLMCNPYVESISQIGTPYKKVSRIWHPEDSVVDVAGVKIGGKEKIVVMGGPCSVEGLEQICDISQEIKNAGGRILRGGAYKPRTSPYTFQGLGREGIMYMTQARKLTGLPIVSEIMSTDKIDEFVENVDLIQVGARNMQNFDLLKALGKTDKPILLKRGLSNTIEEWLMSAEYIMAGGNNNVILCERGIRTFETYTRNTLDLSVVQIVKKKTHLPIVIDPSHATGNWELVESMSLAAVAAGADGLMIEVHPQPECAWSDGQQSLKPKNFKDVVEKARAIAKVVGRDL